MKIKNAGLKALTVESEQKEIEAIGTVPLVLEYLNGSDLSGAEYGIDTRLWNVVSPQIPGYNYKKNSGQVTLGIDGLSKHFSREQIEAAIKTAKVIRQGIGK